MLRKRYNKLAIAVLIILLSSISVGVLSAAPVSVSVLVADYITFIFDGRSQPLPEGYTVLMHENRSYVPARFVAEQLGANVTWDGNTRTIRIASQPCPECTGLEEQVSLLEGESEELKQKIVDLEAKIKTLEEEKEKTQPDLDYRRLPVSKILRDINVDVTLVVLDDGESFNRIYLAVENKQNIPLQLLHQKTVAVVNGIEYKAANVPVQMLDERWYHNINSEEIKEGYVVLPAIPESGGNMLLTLTVLYNDADQRTVDLEFAIRY